MFIFYQNLYTEPLSLRANTKARMQPLRAQPIAKALRLFRRPAHGASFAMLRAVFRFGNQPSRLLGRQISFGDDPRHFHAV